MQVSTSLRWSVATTAVLLAVDVAIGWWKVDTLVDYESAAARATIPVPATVARVDSPTRSDTLVTVSYRDVGGSVHEATFPVEGEDSFRVGDAFDLRAAPGSSAVYPFEEAAYTPSFFAGMWLLLLALVAWLPIVWLVRLTLWWRAGVAPKEKVTAQLYWGKFLLERGGALLTAPAVWVEIRGADGGSWYQHVMWEPWLADHRTGRFTAYVQRARPGGSMLITTSQGGRLRWASRARRSTPLLTELQRWRPRRGGTRWWAVAGCVVAAQVAWVIGPAAVVMAATSLLGSVLLYGGNPVVGVGRGRRRR
jgi:hypothetical protein